MNKTHVDFALEKWAEAKGWKRVNSCNMESKPHWHDEDGDGIHFLREKTTIDMDFCRELSIRDESKYFFALTKILGITERMREFWDLSEYKAIHNATVEQRLEAYYEAHK